MRRLLLSGGLVFILSLFITLAQAQDDLCPEIVEFALASVSNSCSNLGRNSVCYGYNHVDATFNVDVPDGFFTEVADIAPLLDLETLQTAGLDVEHDIWGVTVMNVQANLPNTLPGQSVTILLMGDSEIHNEVDADSAFIPGEALSVITVAPASNIRSAPSTTASVPGSVPAGTEFEADGQSPDGEWLRIVFEDRPGWINTGLVAFDEAIADLPVIESGQFTPMQAFTFSTGIGQPVCNRAPDSIMIQGPENIDVTINANGADITIGSTIVLKTLSENTMQVLTLTGSALIDGVVVPGGFTVSTELSPEGDAIPGTLSDFRALSDAELAELSVLEDVNPDLIQYPIILPSRGDILRLQNTITNRENAIQDCRDHELTAQQCLNIIGSDGNLANRLQRCLDFGLASNICQAIIGGQLDSQIVIQCLSQGYQTEVECREAFVETSETIFQGFCESGGAMTEDQCLTFCESQGFSNLDDCQEAAISLVGSGSASNLLNLCQAYGASTLQECQTLCTSQGYTTIEECVAAANQSNGNGQTAPASSTLTPQQVYAQFCQSIGASTAQECAQICVSNGYNTPSSCRDGMG